MPIPSTDVHVMECIVNGVIDSGGSDSIDTQFVFHYARAASALAYTKTALHTALLGGITALTPFNAIRDMLNVAWTHTNTTIRNLDDAQDPMTVFTNGQTGAITGDRLPSEVTAYCLLKTDLRGGSYRGSKHFGPFSESDIGDDILSGAAITRINTWATRALSVTDSIGNVWNLAIVPRGEPNQFLVNPTTVTWNPVTSIVVRQTLGYLKSRKVRSVY